MRKDGILRSRATFVRHVKNEVPLSKISSRKSGILRPRTRKRVISLSSATSGASDSESSMEIQVIHQGSNYEKMKQQPLDEDSISSTECLSDTNQTVSQTTPPQQTSRQVTLKKRTQVKKKPGIRYDKNSISLGTEILVYHFHNKSLNQTDHIQKRKQETIENDNEKEAVKQKNLEKLEPQMTNYDTDYFQKLRQKFETAF